MVFKKVCPRCKRRYPPNFTACLECGSVLIDTEKEAKKAELKKHLPFLAALLICGAIIAAVLFFVLPLVQYSLTTGQETGTLSKTAGRSTAPTTYSMNQPASNGNLQVTIVKIRDGSASANSRKFIFVTVTLQNLRADTPIRVAAADFTLLDTAGVIYPSYGLGDKIGQDIGPLHSESYDLIYEIPNDAANMKIRYTFAGPAEGSGRTVYFLL
jgi:ribosomal protein L40E